MGLGCVNWVDAGVFCFCRMHRDEACTECKYFTLQETPSKPDVTGVSDGMPLSA